MNTARRSLMEKLADWLLPPAPAEPKPVPVTIPVTVAVIQARPRPALESHARNSPVF